MVVRVAIATLPLDVPLKRQLKTPQMPAFSIYKKQRGTDRTLLLKLPPNIRKDRVVLELRNTRSSPGWSGGTSSGDCKTASWRTDSCFKWDDLLLQLRGCAW